jgi:hypothetical protein
VAGQRGVRVLAPRGTSRWLFASAFSFGCAVLLASASLARAESPGTSPPDQTSDDLLASVAGQVPAFGGMYVDESAGKLYIWLTDQGQSLTAADQALQSVLGDPTLASLTPVALAATYSFTQLKAWSDRMSPVLSIQGVVSTDIDDRSNRLSVGVENVATQGPAVQAQLTQLGIPVEAVNIVQTEPVTFVPVNRNLGVRLTVIAAASLLAVVAGLGLFTAWKRRWA